MDLRHSLRNLGLGRLLYLAWHRPRALLRQSLREGGPLGQYLTERGRRQMLAAAQHLPSVATDSAAPLSVHLLTGTRFWFQTAFCLQSLAFQTGRPVAPALYDDGTLSDQERAVLARLFPLGRIVSIEEARASLDRHLPRDRYPVLRERWDHYPNIRKLIDPHIGSHGWKLVLDSDMLFYRRPDALLAWMEKPGRPLHALDCTESYGYSRELMESLSGNSLPVLLNVGICGLRSDSIDWKELEHWTATLIAREKTSYYLEQALVAMIVARTVGGAHALQAHDYVTLPTKSEALLPKAVLHHYVDTSKRWYFRHCWRLVANDLHSCASARAHGQNAADRPTA